MMKQEFETLIDSVCRDLFAVEVETSLTRPDEQFGDYASNVALQLAKQLGKNPRELAAELAAALNQRYPERVEATVAGPGFLNVRIKDGRLLAELALIGDEAKPYGSSEAYAGQVIVTEYSDPNPFKVLHAGHLYTSVVGDAIANLFEVAGAEVHRVNFGGDVGMHVGKTLWAIVQELGGEHPDKLNDIDPDKRSEWMAAAYVKGNNAYEEDPTAKVVMQDMNKQVYRFHADDDHDSPLAQIYWTCRGWSYDYFNQFYARIGTKFEKYYPESETAGTGLATVKEHIGEVFEKSDGAVVFRGEKYGLHTRVFINSEGIPTYEAKDVGLIMKKWQEYHFDKSIVITGNEQQQYMAVVLKAIEQFAPELAQASAHLTHGIVKLAGGVKMSSRKGNILRAVDVLDVAAAANKAATGNEDDRVVLGAVKYAFLKQRIGGDIIYDPDESVSLQGNSGPYLQYAHARARNILVKAPTADSQAPNSLESGERTLLRKLTEYPEVVATAIEEMMPHHIGTYLYELAQTFNRFYEHNRVLGDAREAERLALVRGYAAVLSRGLSLLGIAAPESM